MCGSMWLTFRAFQIRLRAASAKTAVSIVIDSPPSVCIGTPPHVQCSISRKFKISEHDLRGFRSFRLVSYFCCVIADRISYQPSYYFIDFH